MMPGAARERITNSRAGTALAPSNDRRRLRSLNNERDLIADIVELAKTSKRFRCSNCVRFFLQFFGVGAPTPRIECSVSFNGLCYRARTNVRVRGGKANFDIIVFVGTT